MNTNEVNEKVKLLRSEIINQLKNSEWDKIDDQSFGNKYFIFRKNGSRWRLSTNLNQDIYVEKIMPVWYFKLLKLVYTDRSIKKSDFRRESVKTASFSDNFFKANKDLKRDSKINQILD